jgi:hypothetical protein
VSRATRRVVGICIRCQRGGPSGRTADQIPILDIEATSVPSLSQGASCEVQICIASVTPGWSRRHDLSRHASLPSSRPHGRSRCSHPHSDERHRPPRSRVPRCQMRPQGQTPQGMEPSNAHTGQQSRSTVDGSFYRRRRHRSGVGPTVDGRPAARRRRVSGVQISRRPTASGPF